MARAWHASRPTRPKVHLVNRLANHLTIRPQSDLLRVTLWDFQKTDADADCRHELRQLQLLLKLDRTVDGVGEPDLFEGEHHLG